MSIRCTIGRCTLHSPSSAQQYHYILYASYVHRNNVECRPAADRPCTHSVDLFRWKWNMPRTTIPAGQTSSMECHSFAITVACVHCRKCIAYAVWNTTARTRPVSLIPLQNMHALNMVDAVSLGHSMRNASTIQRRTLLLFVFASISIKHSHWSTIIK